MAKYLCGIAFLSYFIACISFSYAQINYYAVTLPQVMRSNSDYVIVTTYHGLPTSGSTAPLNIAITITGGTSPVKKASATVSVAPGTVKQMPIKIGDWAAGNYVVTITGSGPLTFTDARNVNLNTKSVSILIQTDKGIYQPSQLVQFRVVLVDSNLVPYEKETLSVKIKDSQDNIIQQWNNAVLDHGVFQEILQLSEQPVMGDWSIIAQVGSSSTDLSKTNTVTFTVEEYVLPKFDVAIDTPYVTFEDNNYPTFTITVTSKYTFKGAVDGNLELTVSMANCPTDYYPTCFCCFETYTSCQLTPHTYKVPIKGTATVTVKASDLYSSISPSTVGASSRFASTKMSNVYCLDWIAKRSLAESAGDSRSFEKRVVLPPIDIINPGSTLRDTTVNIVAIVTETVTGIEQNQTTSMTIYAKNRKLSINQPSNFKPGLPFAITVKLTRQDGQPIVSTSDVVTLSLTFTPSASSTPTMTAPMSSDGTVVFNVLPPLTATYLTVSASYQTLSDSASVSAATSKSSKYITVNVKTPKPEVGQNMEVEVQTTFPMTSTLVWVVVGRGNIRASGTVLPGGKTTASFTVAITSYMAPHARIVVYYIDSSSAELVADSIDIDIAGTFRMQVMLTPNATQLEPGENVTLFISAKPNSLVALQSVDMSVLLLHSGNDITQEQVYNELQDYDVGNQVVYFDDLFLVGGWRRPSYSQDFQQIFSYAGLILFTNVPPYTKLLPRPVPMPYLMKDNVVGAGPMLEALAAPMELARMDVAPMAAMANIASFAPVEPKRTRTFFPETFIWTTMNTTADGSIQVTYMVPDTITTYIINAFAMNYDSGMGILNPSKNITVFSPFFIVLQLPYSVVRNETITLKVLVFNYLDTDQEVIVTLTNLAKDFNIIGQMDQTQISITQNVPANGPTMFKILIQPITVGQINLNVKATSARAGDAIIKQLLVKAEGSTEYYNKAIMIDLRNTNTFSEKVVIVIPGEAIPNSEYIEFTAIGDFMAIILINIEELIRMPYGCGEQNMITFVPDIVIMIYLQVTYKLTPDLKDKLLDYMVQGYQRELTYKHNDGSYSAFGMSDPRGSTWLTAFVLKSFNMAKKTITIDEDILTEAKNFLVLQQKATGEFSESGNVIHTSMQGGAAPGAGLTAFVLIAFLEDKNQSSNIAYQSAINRAVVYLEGLLGTISSVYDLSIVTYALQLAPGSTKKDIAFDLLVKRKTVSDGLIYWQASVTKPAGTYSYYVAPTSYDIETTAYALLSYAIRGKAAETLPILRWMVSKRNSLGGYSNSQDTVIGIQALAALGASFQSSAGSSLTITIKYNDQSQSYTLNQQNALVTQKTPLPKTVRTVEISATGSGVGIAQISWNYNVIIRDPQQSFNVTTRVVYSVKPNYAVTVCAKYNGKQPTEMVIYQITTLSGYTWDQESKPAIGSQKGFKRIEFADEGTQASAYFDSLSATEVCITLNAISSGDISNLKDTVVSVYDYYNTFKRGEAYYNLPK